MRGKVLSSQMSERSLSARDWFKLSKTPPFCRKGGLLQKKQQRGAQSFVANRKDERYFLSIWLDEKFYLASERVGELFRQKSSY